MTIKTLLSSLLLFVMMTTYGQEMLGCGTELSSKEERLFNQALPEISKWKRTANKSAATTYIIPVVFHVLSDGSTATAYTKTEMKCRIDDAISITNKDFNGLFPEFLTTDPRFDAVKSTMDIEFVLATVDPDGNLMETPGMDWHPEAHIISGYDSKIYDYIWYGKNNKYYLDIVLVDEPNPSQGATSSGHAFIPTQDVVPHVSYNHRYIGTTCGSEASAGFAKVLTHEFGHYFGLRHTFKDECDAINDGMADTPQTPGSEGCTRDVLNTCNAYANLENYMDYNVSCQIMFTNDQTTAMTFWLEDTTAFYPRRHLWQTSNLVSVGVEESIPIANFSSSTTAICSGNTISFKDISLGLPTSSLWTFEGGTPTTSTDKNPTVTYNTTGSYKVTLVSTNSLGTDTKEIINYIEVDLRSTNNLTEDFSGAFPPDKWEINNPDSGLEWQKRDDVGNGDSSSVIMNNSDNKVSGELDYLRFPYLDFTNANNSQLFFDVAYTKFDDNSPDVLTVQVSTDCGVNWTDVYTKTHTDLETRDILSSLSNGWKPASEADWRREIIDLNAYQGNNNVSIRFKNVSGYGTRIWIDNVNVAITQADIPNTSFSSSIRDTKCNSVSIPFEDASTGNPTIWNWSFPGGTPATSTDQNPVVVYDSPGDYNVTLTTENASGTGNTVTKNNFITVINPIGTSFTESFESNFAPNNWEVVDLDYGLTWEKRTDAGRNSASCMIMNNADNSTVGEIDEIILAPLDLSIGTTDFSFDVAYAKFDADSPDKLEVLMSKDCGVTWVSVYSKTHLELETFVSATPNDWIPTLDSHWRLERVSLSAFNGESNVLIKFKNTSGYGARVWIDNVKLTFDSQAKPFSEFIIDQELMCSDLPIVFKDNSIGDPTSWAWSFPGGTPATSTLQNPEVIYATTGDYSVTLVASNVHGQGTSVVKTDVVQINAKETLPVTETFLGVFPKPNWMIFNPDNDAVTWEKRSDVGNGDLSCMIINNADNPKDLVDELILSPLDLTNNATPFFHFDLAYTEYRNSYDTTPIPAPDKIDILVSSDCGDTWTNVYSKDHLGLQTVSPPIEDDASTPDDNETNDWKPTIASDWRAEMIDLSVVKNEPSVLIKLVNTSGYGTPIWFDNFNIIDSAVLDISLQKISDINVVVYPNPSNSIFNIKLPSAEDTYQITVHDVIGRLLFEKKVTNKTEESIDLKGGRSGVYLLEVKDSNGKTYNNKLLKK